MGRVQKEVSKEGQEGVREKLSKMDLKLLAWATKWMVMSLTEVGNRGVRRCSI